MQIIGITGKPSIKFTFVAHLSKPVGLRWMQWYYTVWWHNSLWDKGIKRETFPFANLNSLWKMLPFTQMEPYSQYKEQRGWDKESGIWDEYSRWLYNLHYLVLLNICWWDLFSCNRKYDSEWHCVTITSKRSKIQRVESSCSLRCLRFPLVPPKMSED